MAFERRYSFALFPDVAGSEQTETHARLPRRGGGGGGGVLRDEKQNEAALDDNGHSVAA